MEESIVHSIKENIKLMVFQILEEWRIKIQNSINELIEFRQQYNLYNKKLMGTIKKISEINFNLNSKYKNLETRINRLENKFSYLEIDIENNNNNEKLSQISNFDFNNKKRKKNNFIIASDINSLFKKTNLQNEFIPAFLLETICNRVVEILRKEKNHKIEYSIMVEKLWNEFFFNSVENLNLLFIINNNECNNEKNNNLNSDLYYVHYKRQFIIFFERISSIISVIYNYKIIIISENNCKFIYLKNLLKRKRSCFF